MYAFRDYRTLEDYVASQIVQQVFPVGTVCSLPVLVQNGNRAFIAVFLYKDHVSSDSLLDRPFAWVIMPADGGSDIMFSWCSAFDFVPTESYPLDSQVSAYIPRNELSASTLEVYRQELLAILREMSTFAFSQDLDDFQRGLVNRYKELFLQISYQGLYPYYDAISTEFFDWIDLLLVAKSDSESIRIQRENEIYSLIEGLSSQINASKLNFALLENISKDLEDMKSVSDHHLTLSMERDVILILDHVEKNLTCIDKNNPTPAGFARVLKMFEAVHQDLVDLLYRQGVDPYSSNELFFDVNRQKVIETIPTADPQLDKKVAERLTKGWAREGHIIRPEHVKVYLYNKPGSVSDRPKELFADE